MKAWAGALLGVSRADKPSQLLHSGISRGLRAAPSSIQNALKPTAGAVGWCLDEEGPSYAGGGAGPDSVISVHVPERRRARRRLGLSTTWPSSSRRCLALKDRIRSRL
jgi:hypothetical protein